MKIINLPAKGDAIVTILPTATVRPYDKSLITMTTFTLASIEYSLEEAPAIEGFLGFVHVTEKGHVLHNSAVYRDEKGLPRPVVAVCYVKPTKEAPKC